MAGALAACSTTSVPMEVGSVTLSPATQDDDLSGFDADMLVDNDSPPDDINSAFIFIKPHAITGRI